MVRASTWNQTVPAPVYVQGSSLTTFSADPVVPAEGPVCPGELGWPSQPAINGDEGYSAPAPAASAPAPSGGAAGVRAWGALFGSAALGMALLI
jgi:hypothetical protein